MEPLYTEEDIQLLTIHTKKYHATIGSSVITIPRLLEYFTIGIEYHNIHHFDILVPGYNIQQCYEDGHKQLILKDIKVGYIQMFKSLFHVLYNEDTGRYESSPFFRKIGLQW